MLGVKVSFVAKFCSRHTHAEVRATKNLRTHDLCCENLASASPIRARTNLYPWRLCGGCVGHLRVILNVTPVELGCTFSFILRCGNGTALIIKGR